MNKYAYFLGKCAFFHAKNGKNMHYYIHNMQYNEMQKKRINMHILWENVHYFMQNIYFNLVQETYTHNMHNIHYNLMQEKRNKLGILSGKICTVSSKIYLKRKNGENI